MAAPIVDTFEHDIADEIRHKEASITDIASAVGDVGNNKDDTPSNNSNVLIFIALLLVLCAIVGIVIMGYLYFSGKYDPFAPPPVTPVAETKKPTATASQLSTLSPLMQEAFGMYVTGVTKNNSGYIITISSYSPVFSYMIKNEQAYKNEIGVSINTASGRPNQVPDETPTATTDVSTTSVVASYATTSTSTGGLPEYMPEPAPLLDPNAFSDVTIDNQNMRVGTSLFGPVVYAFIGTNHLVISSSTGGVLLLRNSVLKK